jgi:hypothetical protein
MDDADQSGLQAAVGLRDERVRNMRINDFAREIGVKSVEILDFLPSLGSTEQRSHSSDLSPAEVQQIRLHFAPARLDLERVRALSESFPGDGWKMISARSFWMSPTIGAGDHGDWRRVKHLSGVGGVYAVLLPTPWFMPCRTLLLHAPHTHKGPIRFEFTLADLTGDGFGVVYVGRTSDLRRRWRLHLSRGQRKGGGQVKFGLKDCDVAADIESALQKLRENGRIVYTELPGREHCANRDVLEVALCARFGPPFNIKSER